MSSFTRKHDCISTLSDSNGNVWYLCSGWCWVYNHAFQHICCHNNSLPHATADPDYLFLHFVLKCSECQRVTQLDLLKVPIKGYQNRQGHPFCCYSIKTQKQNTCRSGTSSIGSSAPRSPLATIAWNRKSMCYFKQVPGSTQDRQESRFFFFIIDKQEARFRSILKKTGGILGLNDNCPSNGAATRR